MSIPSHGQHLLNDFCIPDPGGGLWESRGKPCAPRVLECRGGDSQGAKWQGAVTQETGGRGGGSDMHCVQEGPGSVLGDFTLGVSVRPQSGAEAMSKPVPRRRKWRLTARKHGSGPQAASGE